MITLSIEEVTSRIPQIQNLLEPLRPVTKGTPLLVACDAASRAAFEFVWAVFEPGPAPGPPPSSRFPDWRIRTQSEDITASYYEKWARLDVEPEAWALNRAYLTLYRPDEEGEKRELICLHVDPVEPVDAPHARYKRVPHIHLETAPHPIPRIHLGLNNCCYDRLQTSLPDLEEEMRAALVMLAEELLAS